jgi:hypothetical protein
MMCLLTLKREIQFYKPLTAMKALNGQRQFRYSAVLLVAIEIAPTFLLDRIQPPYMYSSAYYKSSSLCLYILLYSKP